MARETLTRSSATHTTSRTIVTSAVAILLAATAVQGFQGATFQGLGTLPGASGILGSHANGVSSDGSTVVGWSHTLLTERSGRVVEEAFRWTASSGMEGLARISHQEG